jgi:hypothetical protein
MFIAALAYRQFVQRDRTPEQKKLRLAKIAARAGMTEEEVLSDYERGTDILDPEAFWKEDILQFARENNISDDPLVLAFLSRAKTREEWENS